jgi:hypothetical protein
VPDFFRTIVPERRRLPHPASTHQIVLERRLNGLKYRETFSVEGFAQQAFPESGVDWAQWDHRGRLAFLRHGALCALDVNSGEQVPRVLVDLTADVPTPVAAPAHAQEWPKTCEAG